MNLRQMEVFRAVMLTGSVSAAAELLHVSQPAVSKVLAYAVRRSGLVLFERIKGRLVPTPEAQQLYAEIDRLWRGVEKVQGVSRELANPKAGTLRLAVTASLAPLLVPRTIVRLYERYPELKCRMDVLVPNLLVEALLDRSIHVGVGLLLNEHPNVTAVKSYSCGLACVMPPDHPLARRRVIRPVDLVGHRLISSPSGTPYGQALERAYAEAAGKLRIDTEVRSATTACWFAQAGAGVAVVDAAAIAGGNIEGLVVRPFQTAERLVLRVLRNGQYPMSTIEKAFVQTFDDVWRESSLLRASSPSSATGEAVPAEGGPHDRRPAQPGVR